MGAPHVAAAAALYLAGDPAATPAAVATAVVNNATANIVINAGMGSPANLLYIGSAALSAPMGGSSGGMQLLGNSGFESGNAAPWVASSGVVDGSTSEAAHSGTWKAWLDGYGTAHTDSLYQDVTIPSNATSATLTFCVHVDS